MSIQPKRLHVAYGAMIDLIRWCRDDDTYLDRDNAADVAAHEEAISATMRALACICARGYMVGSYKEAFHWLREICATDASDAAIANLMIERYALGD